MGDDKRRYNEHKQETNNIQRHWPGIQERYLAQIAYNDGKAWENREYSTENIWVLSQKQSHRDSSKSYYDKCIIEHGQPSRGITAQLGNKTPYGSTYGDVAHRFPYSVDDYVDKSFFVNLYKEYSYLKLRDLEELPCFGVMIWQLCHLLRSAMNCIQITLYNAKVK